MLIIEGNKVKTSNNLDQEIKENGKTYYVCCICGRKSFHKIKSYGHIYCCKHYKQIKKYKKVIDNNPRTILDKNEYHIVGNTTIINIYDRKCNVIAQTIIDTEDLSKVKNIKWKLSQSGYVMNTPKFKNSTIHMSRVILGTDQFVDHINHNTLDNRKKNLRIVTKSQNQMNVNYNGVYEVQSSGKWIAKIKINGKQLYLGVYVFKEEAMFARWYAETLLFKEYRYPKKKPIILQDREEQIKEYVNKKVQRL